MTDPKGKRKTRVLGDGRYVVRGKLGEGGMAVVYRAHDTRLDTDVVIKIPRPALLADKEFKERFRREIRSLVTLPHPHIVKIHDVGEHNGVPFVVMQHLSGGSLEDRRKALRTMKSWLPQICSALDFIHSRGYVHRDIKPGNILFDDNGNAYLSDFGIVKAMADAERSAHHDATLTRTGMVVGTPDYMAPEVIMGEAYDGRADQYSLAVMVHEMLAGEKPFAGPTPAAVMVKHTSTAPPSLTTINPQIRESLAETIVRALAKDPDERFANCEEFWKALRSSSTGVDSGSVVPAAPSDWTESHSLTSEPTSTAHPSDADDRLLPLTGARRQTGGAMGAILDVVRSVDAALERTAGQGNEAVHKFLRGAVVAFPCLLVVMVVLLWPRTPEQSDVALKELGGATSDATSSTGSEGNAVADVSPEIGESSVDKESIVQSDNGNEPEYDPNSEPSNSATEPTSSTNKPPSIVDESTIEAALSQPTRLAFIETPLDDIVHYLANRHAIHIILDTRALDDIGIGTNVPITVRVEHRDLATAFDTLLDPLKLTRQRRREVRLTWVVFHDTLLITTKKTAERMSETRVYRVLTAQPPDSLINDITRKISPTSWDKVGGPGAIETLPFGALVVLQTQSNHRQMESQYADRLKRVRPTIPPEFPTSIGGSFSETLAEPARLEFIRTPLEEIVAFLRDQHDVPIEIDTRALDDVGIGTNVPITCNLRGIGLSSALSLILRNLTLTWTADGNGIRITSERAAASKMESAQCHVEDLAQNGQSDYLIKAIRSTVAPQTWDRVGGPGSLRQGSGGTLDVRQSFAVHRQLAQLLADLREVQKPSEARGSRATDETDSLPDTAGKQTTMTDSLERDDAIVEGRLPVVDGSAERSPVTQPAEQVQLLIEGAPTAPMTPGDVVELRISTSDESPPSAVRLEGKPAGMAFDSTSGECSWQVGIDQAGKRYTLRFSIPGTAAHRTLELETKALPFPKTVRNSVDMTLVLIPAGVLYCEWQTDRPRPLFNRQPFYLGSCEVTQIQYSRIMGRNPSRYKGAQRPAESMGWLNAARFCNKLSEKEGLSPFYLFDGDDAKPLGTNGYRMPTPGEWCFAAFAGTDKRSSLSFVNSSLDDHCWWGENSRGQTHDVGTKRANPFGLYDMFGNVWEYAQYPIFHGGWAWFHKLNGQTDGDPRIAFRTSIKDDKGGSHNGFRVARNVD